MSTIEPPASIPDLTPETLFAPGAAREVFEKQLLPAYIPRCRWFAGKARDPQKFTVRDVIQVEPGADAARLMLVEVEYADKSTEIYLLPLQYLGDPEASALTTSHPNAIVTRDGKGVVCDAIHDGAFRAALLNMMIRETDHAGEHGHLSALGSPALKELESAPPSRALALEQSNSSILYGEEFFFKLYRRLEPGINPDAEILHFLSGQNFTHTPPFTGSIEYRGADGSACVLALATGMVRNNGDAWSYTLRELARWFSTHLQEDIPTAAELESALLRRAAQLGTRTAQMHLALAKGVDDPDFSPQPFTAADGQHLTDGILASIQQVAALMTVKMETLPDPARNLAKRFLESEGKLQERANSLSSVATAAKIRCHGDYHLGQVLETGGDFMIIDFEGEPLRSLPVRRERRSPFRDVAGMLRSFDYAAHAALDAQPTYQATLEPHASRWSTKAQEAFLESWLSTTAGAVFRPATPEEERRLLDAFLLEKALYEVVYEINNRQTWLPIPLRGVLQLVDDKS